MKNIYSAKAGARALSVNEAITVNVNAGAMTLNAKASKPYAITACHNLRPSHLQSGLACLKPVGEPVRVSDKPMRPLATMSSEGRSYLVCASANTLHIFEETSAEPISDVARLTGQTGRTGLDNLSSLALESEVLCALADGERLTVMTATRAYRFTMTDGQLRSTDTELLPSVSLYAEDAGEVTARAGGRKLSRSYTSATQALADSDLRGLTDDMRRAYTDICRQAAANGAFVAPMVCRYRLINRQGEALVESPPLLLGPSDSSRLTAPVTLKSSDRLNVAACQMAMPSWRPAVRLNGTIPEALRDMVDRIEVVASCGFHPYDDTEMASASLVADGASDDFIRITAAGAWKAVASANSRQAQSRLARIACRPECMTNHILTARITQEGSLETTVYAATADPGEECRQLDRLMATAPAKADCISRRISPPHGFTAGCGVAAAGQELWGRLRALRFRGYPAEVFAASRASQGAWHAAVSVSFGNGEERVTAVSEGLSGAPLTFGPLLSYPSPDATSMTIIVSAAGEVRTATFRLTPDATNTHAIYVHPTLQPHWLTDTLPAMIVPAERRTDIELEQYMCICAAPSESAPRRPSAVTAVSDGKVRSVWPCGRLGAGWESDRQRFIVISDAGIHRATLSTSGQKPKLSLTLTDRETPPGDHSVTRAGDMLLAALGRRIVKIGSGTVKTVVDGIDAESLAYAAASDELWTDTPQGVKVIDLKRMSCYSRDAYRLGASVGNYAEVDGYTVDLSRETTPARTYVRWSGCVASGDRYTRLREAVLDLRSEAVASTTLTLRRMSHDNAETSATCRLNIDGRIGAPVAVRCLSLPARGFQFDLQGRMSHDTSITSMKITTL